MTRKMNLIIGMSFLFGPLKSDQVETSFYNEIGTAFEATDAVYFYENFQEVSFFRNYASPCVLSDQFLRILKENQCDSSKDTKQIPHTTMNLLLECQSVWQSELDEITEITAYTSSFSSAMKRIKRQTIAAVSSFVNLVSTLVNTVTVISNYFSSREIEDSFKKLIIKSKAQNLIVAKGLDHQLQTSLILRKLVCESEILNNAGLKRQYANRIIKSYQNTVETETISLAFGEYPRSLEILKDICKLCAQIGTNTAEFCQYMLFNGIMSFKYEGTRVNSTSLLLTNSIKIKIPIQAVNLRVNQVIKIVNLGTWDKNNSYFQIDLPDAAVIGQSHFNLDTKMCHLNACEANAVSITPGSKCLRNIIQNKDLSYCDLTYKEPPQGCDIRRLAKGNLIRADSAVFLTDSPQGPGSVEFLNETKLIPLGGRIFCGQSKLTNKGRDATTYIVNKPLMTYQSNASSSNIFIDTPKLNFSEVDYAIDSSIIINEKLNDLMESEDKIRVGTYDVPIIILIFIGLLIALLVIFIKKPVGETYNTAVKALKRLFSSLKTKAKSIPNNESGRGEGNTENPNRVNRTDDHLTDIPLETVTQVRYPVLPPP